MVTTVATNTPLELNPLLAELTLDNPIPQTVVGIAKEGLALIAGLVEDSDHSLFFLNPRIDEALARAEEAFASVIDINNHDPLDD